MGTDISSEVQYIHILNDTRIWTLWITRREPMLLIDMSPPCISKLVTAMDAWNDGLIEQIGSS